MSSALVFTVSISERLFPVPLLAHPSARSHSLGMSLSGQFRNTSASAARWPGSRTAPTCWPWGWTSTGTTAPSSCGTPPARRDRCDHIPTPAHRSQPVPLPTSTSVGDSYRIGGRETEAGRTAATQWPNLYIDASMSIVLFNVEFTICDDNHPWPALL